MSKQPLKVDLTKCIGDKYGKDGHLEVVDAFRNRDSTGQTRIVYALKCHICATDPELFGSAIFNIAKGNLHKGAVPCGCAANPKWSDAQYKIRIQRECESSHCEVVEYKDGSLSSTTKVLLRCPYHNLEWIGQVNHLLVKGVSCPKCKIYNYREDDAVMIQRFFDSGRFADGTIFARSLQEDKNGNEKLWDYFCPTCSKDEFVEAGLCSGIFTSTSNALRRGIKTCRCALSPHLTKEQQEFRARRAANGQVEFLGWKDGYNSIKSVLLLECPTHGVQEAMFRNFLTNQTKCPECAVGGFDPKKPSYFYVLKVVGRVGDFVGYGITSSLTRRLYTHKAALSKNGYTIEQCRVFTADGFLLRDFETTLKRKLPSCPQEVSGFKTEATTVNMYPEVIRLAENSLETHYHPVTYKYRSMPAAHQSM